MEELTQILGSLANLLVSVQYCLIALIYPQWFVIGFLVLPLRYFLNAGNIRRRTGGFIQGEGVFPHLGFHLASLAVSNMNRAPPRLLISSETRMRAFTIGTIRRRYLVLSHS